ncbi:MAG: hypothetical protein OXG81_07830 [Acidobacteria bacterium]|nr:hypothetical protein [Acidobacteriota bacterium]
MTAGIGYVESVPLGRTKSRPISAVTSTKRTRGVPAASVSTLAVGGPGSASGGGEQPVARTPRNPNRRQPKARLKPIPTARLPGWRRRWRSRSSGARR